MDKICRESVLLEDSSKVAIFLLWVVLCADDPSGPVVKTFTTPLFMWVRLWDSKWRYQSMRMGFL